MAANLERYIFMAKNVNILKGTCSSVLGKRVCQQCLLLRHQSTKIDRNHFLEKGYPLLVIPALSFGLGVWQIQRRQWKLDLIKCLKEKTNLPPIPLPDCLEELDNLEYRRVSVKGIFDHNREVYIGPRSLVDDDDKKGGGLMSDSKGHGFHVVTPFVLRDKPLTILVNRGWVPKAKKDPKTRSWSQVDGEVEIVGIVRKTEVRQPFQPKDIKTDERSFLRRDVEELATKLNTSNVFLDADKYTTLKEGPIGGQTRVTLRNEHLSYIITWFTLSAATSFLWYRRYYRPSSMDSMPDYLRRARAKKP